VSGDILDVQRFAYALERIERGAPSAVASATYELMQHDRALRVSRQSALDALADLLDWLGDVNAQPEDEPLFRARALIERESHRGAPAPVVLGDQAEEKQ
jgi:hypothetical protein